MNTSDYTNEKTANTCTEIAALRAYNLACIGTTTVLETCVGPSFNVLSNAYWQRGIEMWGNDIDGRWAQVGHWLHGDVAKVSLDCFDTVVFAPPLSKGCSGKREDSLMPEEVTPSYESFLNRINLERDRLPDLKTIVLVLPARSISTREDRAQYYKILAKCHKMGTVSEKIMSVNKRNIRKYIDIIVQLEQE